MGEIVDNAPELDLSDPKTTELLNSLRQDAPAEEEKDVKEPEVSSTPEPVKEEVEEEVEDKDAVIRGLRAELTRRAGNAEKVQQLEVEKARLEGELKSKPSTEIDQLQGAIQKLDDKDLLSKQSEWEAELSLAAARYERADGEGSEAGMRSALDRINKAKDMLSRFRMETLQRGERRARERSAQEVEMNQIETELSGMYEAVQGAFPEFTNQESDLWKAGNEEYLANPALMKRMGAAGEVVAAALAIIKNPQLAKAGTAATRKEVINKIDRGLSKALQGGSSSPNFSRKADYTKTVDTGEGLANFNKMIDDIKAG